MSKALQIFNNVVFFDRNSDQKWHYFEYDSHKDTGHRPLIKVVRYVRGKLIQGGNHDDNLNSKENY